MDFNKLQYVSSWIKSNPGFLLVPGVLEKILETRTAAMVEEMPLKKRRTVYARQGDYWNTSWGRMLTDPQSRIAGTRAFKTFRRRFRIPADLFIDYLIPRVKAVNIFDTERTSAIPIEIKCMVALRILGRGSCADDMSEMSGVGESTCNYLFIAFIHGMVKHFFDEVVKPPVGAALDKVLQTYARLGYPGAVGSIDCTHIYWGKCPVELTHLCRGKEKSPTLSFEVVVDHEGFIHSCTKGFVGTCADKMIVVNDPYAKSIAQGLYKDVKYSLYNADGTFTTFSGCYLLSDCGYTRYWMFQMPLLNVHDDRSVYWSEFLESVRKDVERTFGVLKARFLFLAGKVQYHKHSTITAAMRCASILHNWLLAHDKYGRTVWVGMDPDADPEEGAADADPELNNDVEPAIDPEDPAPAALQLHSGLGIVPHTSGANVRLYQHHAHSALQGALITHFEYCYRRGCIVLDCYDTRRTCYASMANSPRHVQTNKEGLIETPISNTRIVVSDPVLGIVHLETTIAIAQHVELFFDYGAEYVYPAAPVPAHAPAL